MSVRFIFVDFTVPVVSRRNVMSKLYTSKGSGATCHDNDKRGRAASQVNPMRCNARRTRQDAATDGHIAGEGALVVDVGACTCGNKTRRREVQGFPA